MKAIKETPIARSLDELDKINGEFYRSLSAFFKVVVA